MSLNCIFFCKTVGNNSVYAIFFQATKQRSTTLRVRCPLSITQDTGGNGCPGIYSIPVCSFFLRPAHPVSPGTGISVTAIALSGKATSSSPYVRKNEGFTKCDTTYAGSGRQVNMRICCHGQSGTRISRYCIRCTSAFTPQCG